MTILVVDDDVAIREMLLQTLEDEGYQVVGAGDGRDGLDQLQAHPDQVRLIVLDLMMPRMNGWEFLQARQGDPALAAIPVIVLSARNDLAQQVATLAIAGFLPKPCNLDQLLEMVARHYSGQPGSHYSG